MPFWLRAWMNSRNHVLDGGPALLRDVAMATNFGRQFAINGFVGYNIGCMIASNTLFNSRGGFRGQAIRWRYNRDWVSKGRNSQTNHSLHFVLVAKGLSKICRDAGTDAGTVRHRRKTPRLAPGQVCDAGTPGQMSGQIVSAWPGVCLCIRKERCRVR